MKYELEPDNRNCPDEELLADLRAVAKQLGQQSLTKDDYNMHGRFCAATMQKRFNSWNDALARSGLNVQKRINIPSEELLADLKRVAEKLQTQSVSREEYRMHGGFADFTVSRHFGNWAAALEKAGLEPTSWRPQATEEILFDNMAKVWEHVGRQPKQKDFHPPISDYSHSTYVNHYGSWRAALEAFVCAANAPQKEPILRQEETVGPKRLISQPVNRTGRDPSWRVRFLVMRRDNFACRLCGASPAKDPSVSLHVDHIKPWSKGGETILQNLQTCCETCNIGKSDLPLNEDS